MCLKLPLIVKDPYLLKVYLSPRKEIAGSCYGGSEARGSLKGPARLQIQTTLSSVKHVAVLAFPFGSHPWPLANLLLRLATATSDVHFSFLNTAKSNGVIFPLPSRAELPSNVRVYDVSDGLQDDCQGATKHPREHVDLFLKAAPESFGAAVDVAEQDVRKKVSCLLTDAFLIFAGEMAEKMQVPWVTLWIPAPYSLAAHVYTDVISELLRESSGGGTSTDDDKSLSAVVMNSYAEVNPTPLITDLKSKFKMLLQVGCLTVSFPPPPLPSGSASDTTGCLTWLDARDPRSVAYICFGTVAMPSPSESGRAYGKFVPWAPQGQVLSHPACGVYVTHCGYNSVFESVAGGVPMVCKPFWADNMMNGRMIEEVWGIGVKVEGGTITKSGMEKALEVVLRGEDGKEMRKKVGELRERLVEAAGPDGSAEADFKVLVELISTS
ncbi:flavonol 3-O-glucosyltransferase F3GT2-like [Eucalyptus grandis]|uniref:flavonol 3-O-glucosyltransferase F3GT2-like n=1 Tax=Eucalyptus grandis TaxID=71139 RepID=UPI00192E81B7|nr:flavonol 3-O-glucosyltransferase F3GT2-like [Eucalyptus grandis]